MKFLLVDGETEYLVSKHFLSVSTVSMSQYMKESENDIKIIGFNIFCNINTFKINYSINYFLLIRFRVKY
jgi:hypothetical protein